MHAGDPPEPAARGDGPFLPRLPASPRRCRSASPRARRSSAAARRSRPSRCATPPKLGCEGPNQMKAFLRCGMGPCQGRLCGLTVTELIAAERGTTPGRRRLLPAASAGEADHAGRARLAADQPRPSARPWSAERWPARADVVIIGGGIHGCSTALHLALRGLKPILIEKDYAGRHASGVNAGGVRQLARDIRRDPAVDLLDGPLGAHRGAGR